VTFLLGGLVGVFTIAHAVKYALAHARAATLAFLVSLIVGALRAPIVEVSIRLAESGETWSAAAPRFALAAVVGAALVLVLDRYSAGSSTSGPGPFRVREHVSTPVACVMSRKIGQTRVDSRYPTRDCLPSIEDVACCYLWKRLFDHTISAEYE